MGEISMLVSGIILVAIVAVIVSNNSATVNLITTISQLLNWLLGVIVSPIA